MLQRALCCETKYIIYSLLIPAFGKGWHKALGQELSPPVIALFLGEK